MTTIVWDGKTLAADTLETSNGIITSETACKLITLQGDDYLFDGEPVAAFACAGNSGSTRILKALLKDNLQALTVKPTGISFSAILVTRKGQGYWLYSDEDTDLILGEPITRDAVGSGAPLARAALALGMDAIAAVEHAARFDTSTGGSVHSFPINRQNPVVSTTNKPREHYVQVL